MTFLSDQDLPVFASMSSGLEMMEAPRPGVGAFFEEQFPSPVAELEMRETSPIYHKDWKEINKPALPVEK